MLWRGPSRKGWQGGDADAKEEAIESSEVVWVDGRVVGVESSTGVYEYEGGPRCVAEDEEPLNEDVENAVVEECRCTCACVKDEWCAWNEGFCCSCG